MKNHDINAAAVPDLGESLYPLIHAAPIAMVVVDSSGRILLANAKFATLFGYQPEEVQNQAIEFLLPAQLRQVHVHHRQGFMQAPHVREMGAGFDLVGRHKNGELIPIEVGLGFGRLHDDIVTIASVIDISLRKQTEATLEARVKERTAELERLYEQIEQNAVAAERSRIAHDLHDSVTQTLFSASIIADILPRLWQRNSQEAERRLHELRELTRGALAEMRTLLLELRPTA
ncbi:MAG: PAS domain-containing sensor histidine kinase, partial [Caldilineaceae bacterium]